MLAWDSTIWPRKFLRPRPGAGSPTPIALQAAPPRRRAIRASGPTRSGVSSKHAHGNWVRCSSRMDSRFTPIAPPNWRAKFTAPEPCPPISAAGRAARRHHARHGEASKPIRPSAASTGQGSNRRVVADVVHQQGGNARKQHQPRADRHPGRKRSASRPPDGKDQHHGEPRRISSSPPRASAV